MASARRFKVLLFVVLCATAGTVQSQDGFASMNGGTTGGARGTTVNVSTESELRAALAGDTPRIIRITRPIRLSTPVRVGSNKTIQGAGPGAGVTGAGFKLVGVRNVIIRGLVISYPKSPYDGIDIDRSTNIWVDHNEFFSDKNHGKDYYDGLLDIKHASDFITISYNKFHDHYKALLIGMNDKDSGDKGKMRVTIHHNHFKNVESRLPLIRFGTAHVYNNLYENVGSSAINSRMDAQVLAENNVFRNVKDPLTTSLYSTRDGHAVARGNDYGGGYPTITKRGSMQQPPYNNARVDPTSSVESVVRSRAGPSGGQSSYLKGASARWQGSSSSGMTPMLSNNGRSKNNKPPKSMNKSSKAWKPSGGKKSSSNKKTSKKSKNKKSSGNF